MALGAYQTDYLLDDSKLKCMIKSRRVGGSYVVSKESSLTAIGYDCHTGGLNLDRGVNEYIISASQHQAEDLLRECCDHLEELETNLTAIQSMIPLASKYHLPMVPDVLWAMYNEYNKFGAPEEAPSNRLGLKALGRALPKGMGRVKLISEMRSDRITLINGRRIEARPANPATVRGCTGNLTFDEFGVMPHSYDIWAAAKPIVDANWRNPEGYRLRIIGTPLGDDNMFYRIAKTDDGNSFSRHWVDVYRAVADGFPLGKRDDGAPKTPDDLLKEIGDFDAFRQEYCCEFLSSSSNYIPSELLDNAKYDPTDESVLQMFSNTEGIKAYGGMDVARSPTGDYSALVVIWKYGDTYWVRPEIWAERGVDFTTQKDIVGSEIEDNGVRRICIDKSGIGMDMAEDLEKKHKGKVEGVKFTTESKEDLATRLRRLLEERRLRIPTSEERLRRDLLSLKRLITAAGNTRFDIERSRVPGKGHGDRAWALALALHAAEGLPDKYKATFGWRVPKNPKDVVQQRRSFAKQNRFS